MTLHRFSCSSHVRRAALATLMLLAGATPAGCARGRDPAPGTSNLSFRDAAGAEVARGWLDLPAKLPGEAQTFGGRFRLVSSRDGFPHEAVQQSGRYAAFVGDAGNSISFNLNPSVADNNVTLAGQVKPDEVRGRWSLSTFARAEPRGTFVLAWPRK